MADKTITPTYSQLGRDGNTQPYKKIIDFISNALQSQKPDGGKMTAKQLGEIKENLARLPIGQLEDIYQDTAGIMLASIIKKSNNIPIDHTKNQRDIESLIAPDVGTFVGYANSLNNKIRGK